jgi:hypothetical protein
MKGACISARQRPDVFAHSLQAAWNGGGIGQLASQSKVANCGSNPQFEPMKIIDPTHPFYRPLWRRLAITAVVAGWLAFEFIVSKSGIWIVVSGAVFAYTAWTLLLSWKDGGGLKP